MKQRQGMWNIIRNPDCQSCVSAEVLEARGRRGHSGSHVGFGHDWELHTERRGGEAGRGI